MQYIRGEKTEIKSLISYFKLPLQIYVIDIIETLQVYSLKILW